MRKPVRLKRSDAGFDTFALSPQGFEESAAVQQIVARTARELA